MISDQCYINIGRFKVVTVKSQRKIKTAKDKMTDMIQCALNKKTDKTKKRPVNSAEWDSLKNTWSR